MTDRRTGVVAAFDVVEGLGTLVLDDGREVGFHATQLSGVARVIEVGTPVTASLVAWHLGRIEATSIEVVGSAGAPDC